MCSDVLEGIEAWIDGELGAEEAARFEAHIAQCASCRTEKSEAEDLVMGLRSLPEFDIPTRVLHSVPGFARPPMWARFGATMTASMRRPATAAAAVGVAILAIVLVSPWRGPSTSKYSDQEIERAALEAQLALAYVGDAVQRAELSVKEKILKDGTVIRTVRGFSRSMRIIGEAATAAAELPATPLPQ
ncbi:MAG: anti-sigma factor family protein [Planctomycetota bacterium]